MEINAKLLACKRKTKNFRANFEKMLAIVQFNKILLMAAAEFRVIDILEGHPKKIKCLDVSMISKIVVSFSEDLIIVHSPMEDEQVVCDHVISVGPLKWKESWRYEIKMPIRNLSMSSIGDFFCISGVGLVSVWTRDGTDHFSYSNSIYISSKKNPNILATVIKQRKLGDIIQQEVTSDGRLIVLLEKNSKTLRVLYQDKVKEKKQEKKKEEESSPFDWRSLNKNQETRYKNNQQKEEKNDFILADNPYADNAGGIKNARDKGVAAQELAEYMLPAHRYQIEYFKILHHDVYESEKRNLPNVILTVTSKNEVFLWQENLMSSEMTFVSVHLFRGFHNCSFFDVEFLEFPPINPKRYVELKSDVSKLFDTERDQTLQVKKNENQYGIYQENYHETTLDWVLILNDSHIEINKIEGLRNFPQKSILVSQIKKVHLSYNPREFYGCCKIFSASCRDFNDVLSLYALNNLGQIIKLRKDFKEHNESKWKIDKIAILHRERIEDVIVHQQLPFVAHNMNNTDLYFYVDEQSKNQVIKRPDMKFLGSYSIYHQTKHHRNQDQLKILNAKWVKDLCQMMIHFSDNTLALLSSSTQIRILAHQKYPDEYLKLWEEKRSQITERWSILFEIKFDSGADAEQIVDYEVLNTQILEDGFKIRIAIFTNKNQYLVYETTTTFDETLKTHSDTALLYHRYTTDNMIKLLGGCNYFDSDDKTVLAIITEVDPNNQPPQLLTQVKATEAAPPSSQSKPKPKFGGFDYGSDEDDNDSEPDDIFGNSYSKPKLKPKAKTVEPVKEAEPLKHQLLLKMVQFTQNSLVTKEYEELWRVEIPMNYKGKAYKCKHNQEFISFMIQDGPQDDIFIFMYDLISNKYIGFINTTEIIGFKQTLAQVDYVLTKGSAKGGLTLFCKGDCYLIAQSSRDGQPGKWSLIRKYDMIVNIERSSISTVQLYESPWRRLIIVINNNHLDIKDKFIEYKDDISKTEQVTVVKSALHQLFTNQQKSFAIYDPRLLKALFIKGYVSTVLKVMVKLQNALINNQGMISEFLDYDLEQIIAELQEVQAQKMSSQGGAQKKQETASSMFDDFYGGFGNDSKAKNEKEEQKDTQESSQSHLEQEFEQGFNDYILNVRALGKTKLGLDEDGKREYIEFAKKFKQLYRKDFASDDLTSILLRKTFFETEEVELEEQDKKQDEKMSAEPFNIANFIQQLRTQPAASKANISLVEQWTSLETALALHSEGQDVICTELQNRFDFDNNLNYEMMKKLCIPVWLKDIPRLKLLVEKVAKVEYKNAGDDFNKSSKAEKTALWYLLIGKKNILLTLYKAEQSQKKIYEFLCQDFTVAKNRTMASKNAMALMGKKNYILSCAFFLLANNLKDAVQVAIDRLQDPILAVLMIRLMDQEDSEVLKDVYLKQFVERGEKIGDPYLQNIGRWQRKEYLKAVNLFQLDTQKQNNIQYILKSDMNDFNLFYSLKKQEQKQDEQALFVPFTARYDYYALDFIRILKKNTNVKRQIQKTWTTNQKYGGGGGGGSIFDDFFAGPSESTANKNQEEEKQEENKLIIEESKILEIVSFETSQRGYSIVSLLILCENSENILKMQNKYKQLLANSLLTDMIQSLMHGEYGQVSKLSKSVDQLSDMLSIDQSESKEFIRKQLKHIDSLNLIIGYLIEEGKEGVMYKVEQEALKQMNFINSLADFPFITDGGFQDKRGINMPKMIDFLENLVESYMLVDYQQKSATPRNVQQEEVKGKKQVGVKKSKFDFDEEDEPAVDGTDEQKGTTNPNIMDTHSNQISRKLTALHADQEVHLQAYSTKLRATVIIYISLIYLCYLSKNLGLVKSLLVDLRAILSHKQTEKNKQGPAHHDINLQDLKTKIQKFKYQLLKPEEEKKKEEEVLYVQVGAAFNQPTKEEEDQKKAKNRMNQFLGIWLRFVVANHLFQLVDYQFEKTHIRSLVDLRPSIIKTRPLNEAIEVIMNPRMSSGEILKKFNNMQRILENVITYMFENILNIQEREAIVKDLKKIQSQKFENADCTNLDLSLFFSKEKKFSQFAQYFQLGDFVKNLKDNELSLVNPSFHDSSSRTVARTQELFEGGIDVFRMKGEMVNGFAFDRCDSDIVALAAQSKGIREIPIRKALLYRTRAQKGHQVVDEELATWQECLKRYDKVSQEHENLKSNSEPIIAIIDKLYSYKTVNYTKKQRRSRGTLFLDYELNPPEMWAGLKTFEYLKPRSAFEISHEEYASCVESHPYLPLYATGNNKGYICLWGFNQAEDRALDHWVTDWNEPKNINQKKATLKKIQFNNYGDKLVACSQEGSVYMYKFDNYESSRTLPIFQLKKQKDMKFNDFELLNYDSVLAMASLKPKHVWIYDILVGQRSGLVMESSIGGNIIQPLRKRNQLMVFNERPGQMNVIDLKMNKVVSSINLHNDEVTSVAMNEIENSFVVGFRDGVIKVYNVGEEYEARESFIAFSTSGNKKGSVTQVKIHPTNGALFASSATGNLKIIRTKI